MERQAFLEAGAAAEHLDVQAGLHYYVGNLENYRKALLVALKSIRGKLPILTGMVQWKEYDGFCAIAGILGKICADIGAAELADWTVRLETAVLNEDFRQMEEELPEYSAELERLLTELEELLRRLDKAEADEPKQKTDMDRKESCSVSDRWCQKEYQPVREVI